MSDHYETLANDEEFKELSARKSILLAELDRLEEQAKKVKMGLEDFAQLLDTNKVNYVAYDVIDNRAFHPRDNTPPIEFPRDAYELLIELIQKNKEFVEVRGKVNDKIKNRR